MLRFGAATVFGLAGLAGLAFGVNPPAEVPPGDLGALQGNWKPLSIEFQGAPQVSADETKKITAVFDQAEYHLYYADKTVNPPKVLKLAVANVILDSSTTPKSITFEFATGELKGHKRHGIYEVAGNQLKLCYGPVEKPKPTQFAAPAGSGLFLEVWAKQLAK
ncbi:MAG: hypothetical protein JWO38_7532 [Gemmataceae bacterium]|nr:hypothetical protein [Gemmataceae bacterium]